jgi:hypothetical protein
MDRMPAALHVATDANEDSRNWLSMSRAEDQEIVILSKENANSQEMVRRAISQPYSK